MRSLGCTTNTSVGVFAIWFLLDALEDALEDAPHDALDELLDDKQFNKVRWQELAHIWASI